VLFPNLTQLDFTGPLQVLSRLPNSTTHIAAKTREPVPSDAALALAPQTDLQIGWRPFQLNPDMPADGMDRQEYLRLKFGDRAGGNMYQAVEEAGRGEGIPFDFDRIKRTPNTILAHRLIRFAQREGRQDEAVETLFRAYFTEGRRMRGRGRVREDGSPRDLAPRRHDLHGCRSYQAGSAQKRAPT